MFASGNVILDESNLSLILNRAANLAVMEMYLSNPGEDSPFIKLTNRFGNGRTDDALVSAVVDAFKKLRAFTYWEKVDDIDLSCFGLTDDGRRIEFSWRTMAGNQSDAITYSGDETSGYKGGSEYFDIKLEEFKKMYPAVKYIVFFLPCIRRLVRYSLKSVSKKSLLRERTNRTIGVS